VTVVGRRVRRWNNEEAVVLDVAYRGEWYALVKRDDGRLECWKLSDGNSGCVEVEQTWSTIDLRAKPGAGENSR
jgi:hypothetical protein